MGASDEFRFVCPVCEESMAVNASMREALVANGCVVCGADVSNAAFEIAEAGR